ncbi:programmed cell death protein 2-like isoform X1 [Numida meleagris]|uniref:programmed cell death protein 2-like isoform X1 n=1 Tax=Numida meleagris TaxID=8996 RepID=UPI000B3D7EC3|nr:programmed cell death protein 2-like isoform X1 [Numida meleagris]
MAAVGPPVLLGLRDAPMVGPCRGGGQPPGWATNKLGGCADALPTVRPGYPRCGACGAALAHLVQVYCPLGASPFHRLANVFACAGSGCWGRPQSWKVLRSQSLEARGQEARGCGSKQKEESNFSAKDWCAEADDWGGCDGTESPTCVLQMLGLNARMSSSASGEAQCVSQLQQLHLSEAADMSGSLNVDLQLREEMMMATSAPVFHPYYISVVDEADYAGFLDTDHANKLLKEYQQREGVDLERLMSESFAGEDSNEKYEKSQVRSGDHSFHKFMKRISVCPEQILRAFVCNFNPESRMQPACSSYRSVVAEPSLPGFQNQVELTGSFLMRRYSWGGQPLFITCPPANFDNSIPACSNCGSNRIFEFQLMPALVSMLQSDADLSVEFGTVIVYTCEQSCWPTNHQTPLEEFIFVQEDPDQKLFK